MSHRKPRHVAQAALVVCALVVAAGCGGGTANGDAGPRSADASDAAPLEGSPGGFITFINAGDGKLYRIETVTGAQPVNLSVTLDGLSPGDDENPSVSKNGAWLTTTSQRFGCGASGDGECLAVFAGDLSAGEPVMANGQPLAPRGRAAISNAGDLIVYPDRGGPNSLDLFALRKLGGAWSAPELLTASSGEAFNDFPALNAAGTRVVFDCGSVPFSQEGTDLCAVGADGGDMVKLVESDNSPLGGGGSFLAHHGDFLSDGSVIFEASWQSEQLWVLRPGASAAVQISSDFSNDNSPCALPGGYIASLWLQRPGNQDAHELRVSAPDASESVVILPDVDVLDLGMSCHDL